MNKKFLSAILFGALMVTSTGTFVSCKDYDDDIENLQGQINSNKDAIAALHKLVGEGNWVTGVTSIANGFTVTMSNGQTTTITGINGKDGVDGKNGTEWTIGEDGFWYMDGEKTAHQAVAKNGENGKPGATAPSPFINADGMWVVYELNAETGEFAPKVTEVSAQGTSAYVVKKDGVYVLHIADETGKFQDVTLPATSDSFVVSAPYSDIEVYFEYAKWNPTTNTPEYKALTEQYPEIKEIAKNALVKQGGHLPVLVTPAAVELTDGFSFSLQQVNGKIANMTVDKPVKGLQNADFVDKIIGENTVGTVMQTRSADASVCYWTLSVEPTIEKGQYVTLSEKPVALVAENTKGTVVKTEFAYKVLSSKNEKEVTIKGGTATYASEIDLLAYDEKTKEYPVALENNYKGYQIITLTNKYQIEKYGLSIGDNRTLKIENMPSDVTSIDVDLNVVTISLNGKTTKSKAGDITVKINQEVAATANLSAKSLTLNGKDQAVKWDIKELGLSALDLDNVLCGNVNVCVLRTYTDEDGLEHHEVVFNDEPTYYNAAGQATTYAINDHKWNNKEGVAFGITLNATAAKVTSDFTEDENTYIASCVAAPAEYEVRFVSTSGNAVIFSAETALTTKLPDVSSTFIKLADGFVENGVLQVIGSVSGNEVSYMLENGFVLKNVTIEKFVDADYDESETDHTSPAFYNWIEQTNKESLLVNVWKTKSDVDEDEDLKPWSVAKWNQLYVTRNLRAHIYFFGNKLNASTYDFKAVVKSSIYSDKPTSVVTIKDDMVSNYGGDAIKIDDITAVYAAGPKKGQEYALFTQNGSDKTTKEVTDYDNPNVSGIYAVNADGAPVEIAKADLTKLGLSAEVYTALGADDKFYITSNNQLVKKTIGGVEKTSSIDGWSEIMVVVNKYYDYKEGQWAAKGTPALKDASSKEKTYLALFDAYKGKLAFGKKSVAVTPTEDTPYGEGLAGEPTVEFANKAEAEKYATLSGFTVTPKAVSDITEAPEKVEIPMNLVIKDVWGMTMKVPFKVTIQTEKPE